VVEEVHIVIKEHHGWRIIIANSAASIDDSNKNDVVVDGSHFGINVGKMALKAGILGMIGNDAGIGLDNCGIAGMKVLENLDIPAASVSCMSAEIGIGTSTYENGIISAVNEIAEKVGIKVGMSAKEAADRMLENALLRASSTGNKPTSIKSMANTQLIVVDSSSDVNRENETDVIVSGSHGGKNGGEYLANLNVKGVVCHDAGAGKNEAGTAGLKILEEHGIPAATVSTMSAYIGNGISTYNQGVISSVNAIAGELGINIGMSAIEAADKMVHATAQK
jgi:uncharacterized protein YunC (DUF1805 family)